MRIACSLIVVLALPACYGSGGRDHITGDAPTDTRVDPPPDTPPDTRPDIPPDVTIAGWEFIDRDVPDRHMPVELLFNVLPDIAWNGTSVGLVYHGMVLGGTEAVGFLPLDERGNTIGPETIVLSGGGLVGVFPRIADAGDGTFLFCAVQEMGDHIVMQRLSPEGEVMARGDSPEEMSISDLLSPPVRIGDYVYTATEAYPPGESAIELYKFRYPGMEFDMATYVPPGELSGDDPILVKDPGGSRLLMFYRQAHSLHITMAGIDPTIIEPDGSITIFGISEVTAFHASSSSTEWQGYGFYWFSSGGSLEFWSFDESSSGWGVGFGADFYNPTMDSDTADTRATGAVISYLADERWDVMADLSAVRGLLDVQQYIAVNDDIGPRDVMDSMNATIAWTGNGFLVVWDEFRPDDPGALFSSYMELVPIY